MSQPPNPNDPTVPSQQPYSQDPPQQPYYPPPPVAQPPRKRRTWLWVVLGVLALLVLGCVGVVALAGRGVQTSTTNTGTAPNGNTPAATQGQPQGSQHFKVGEQVQVDDTWQVTVQSAKTSNGSGFYKPQKSGDVFLIFIVSMKNISSQEQTVSSLVQWSVQDSTGQKYSPTLDPDAGASLDGKVEAGSPLKGSLVYEIPKSVHQLTLAFEADITSPGQTIWDTHV
jgi:hypothetical protein